MPWHIEKRGLRWCVIKDSTGENQGCHLTRAKAERQLAALHASEGEKAMEKKDVTTQDGADEKREFTLIKKDDEQLEKGWVPWGITSFEDLQKFRDAQAKAAATYSLVDDFLGLIIEVFNNYEITDKASAVMKLAKEFNDLLRGATEGTDPDRIGKSWEVIVSKALADEERRLVYGVVLKPDVADAQGDILTAQEIEKAAHAFFMNSRIMDYQHVENLPAEAAVPVESWIAPVDLTINGTVIRKGSWVMTTYVPDDTIWEEIKKGKILSYSIKGWGKRTPLTE